MAAVFANAPVDEHAESEGERLAVAEARASLAAGVRPRTSDEVLERLRQKWQPKTG